MDAEFCHIRDNHSCVPELAAAEQADEEALGAAQALCGMAIVAAVSYLFSQRATSPTDELRRAVHYTYDVISRAVLCLASQHVHKSKLEQWSSYVAPSGHEHTQLVQLLEGKRRFVGKVEIDEEDLLRSLSSGPGSGKHMTLVLDLDETLVHATHDQESRPIEPDFRIFDDETHQYFKVWKRPYLDLFLEEASKLYEIVIYTASYACYADPIIDSIDRRLAVSKRLYNTSVVLTSSTTYEKDLSLASPVNFPKRLIMIDNTATVCETHAENLLVIESFRADNPADNALLLLIPFLQALATVEDVRSVLHRKKYVCQLSEQPGPMERGQPVTPVIEKDPLVAALDAPPGAMAWLTPDDDEEDEEFEEYDGYGQEIDGVANYGGQEEAKLSPRRNSE